MKLESAALCLRILVLISAQNLMKPNYTPCYQVLRVRVALNCSHYNRIMIKRLRQYFHRYAFMQRAT
ncbi:hypothetical protein T11_14517, partial [Trichinella zimbabwensis]